MSESKYGTSVDGIALVLSLSNDLWLNFQRDQVWGHGSKPDKDWLSCLGGWRVLAPGGRVQVSWGLVHPWVKIGVWDQQVDWYSIYFHHDCFGEKGAHPKCKAVNLLFDLCFNPCPRSQALGHDQRNEWPKWEGGSSVGACSLGERLRRVVTSHPKSAWSRSASFSSHSSSSGIKVWMPL